MRRNPVVFQGDEDTGFPVQEHLDGLVLVCRAGETTKSTMAGALSQLGPAKVHGLLMLDVLARYMPK